MWEWLVCLKDSCIYEGRNIKDGKVYAGQVECHDSFAENCVEEDDE